MCLLEIVGSRELANICAYNTQFPSSSVGNSQSKLVIAPSFDLISSMPIHAPLSMICVVPDMFWNVISVLSLTKVDTTGCVGFEELFDHTQQIPSPWI